VLSTADGRTLLVRPGVRTDARAVRDLIDSVADEPDVPLLATPGSIALHDIRGLIVKSAHDSRSLFLVAEVAGVIAGNLGGSGVGFAPSAHVFEFGMSVGAEYRGVGVGGALLEAAVAWAAEQRYLKVVLSAFPHNTRAIAFYERHGFTFEGRRARQFHRGDRYIDEVLMARPIGAWADAGAAADAAPAAPPEPDGRSQGPDGCPPEPGGRLSEPGAAPAAEV
jgi:RimJ/RimL family protein N-acetyltransferase